MTDSTETTAIGCEDPTIVMTSEELALLRLQDASPKTICMVVGEMAHDRKALERLPENVLSRLKEVQLIPVLDELIQQAEDVLASEEAIRPFTAGSLRCAALGIVLMGADGSDKYHKKVNSLLSLLLMIDGAIS